MQMIYDALRPEALSKLLENERLLVEPKIKDPVEAAAELDATIRAKRDLEAELEDQIAFAKRQMATAKA